MEIINFKTIKVSIMLNRFDLSQVVQYLMCSVKNIMCEFPPELSNELRIDKFQNWAETSALSKIKVWE